MKKTIFTLCLAVVAAVGIGVASDFLYEHFTSNSVGTFEVQIINLSGEEVNNKEIEFNKGDSLVPLLERNFDNVVIKDGMLMSIDVLSTPEDWATFICIYVNNEMSNVGILDIEFSDGTLISFVDTKIEY